MNQYYQNFKNTENLRGHVYKYALSLFDKKPIKILEIGTSRRLEGNAPQGDGYSTLFFCEYLKEVGGGKLVICDISQDAINNCKLITSDFSGIIDMEFKIQDGIELIDDTFDLILLDGSDCPYAMVDQYNKINRRKTTIICDDWNGPGGKGDILKTLATDFEEFNCGTVHKMAIYKITKTTSF